MCIVIEANLDSEKRSVFVVWHLYRAGITAIGGGGVETVYDLRPHTTVVQYIMMYNVPLPPHSDVLTFLYWYLGWPLTPSLHCLHSIFPQFPYPSYTAKRDQ